MKVDKTTHQYKLAQFKQKVQDKIDKESHQFEEACTEISENCPNPKREPSFFIHGVDPIENSWG